MAVRLRKVKESGCYATYKDGQWVSGRKVPAKEFEDKMKDRQVKKLAKDVGKVSAELKQVPEEFNKGMEVGKSELEAKKATTVEAPTETNKEEA